MELWERSSALDLLDALLHKSAAGGRIALVPGEAGLGKSALVTAFAERCGRRARVLWGGCDRLVTPRALGPLHDIGRQAGGVLAARLGAGAAQEEIFAAFLDELSGPRQRPRPVIVVEDVHWADEATLDWMALLGRRIGRLPVLLVVTYRDDELGSGHPLRGTLAMLPGAVVRRIPLLPLSPECVGEQARKAGRDPALAYRLTGGNPLLVTELVKAGGRAVPGAVQDLILDRLRALPAPARDLARLVSVVPTHADAAIVAGAADLVDICVDAGVLISAGDGVSFRHELLRSAVEDALSPPRRAELHRRVLDVLVGVPGIDPGRLVHHARHAGDFRAVLRYGQSAGAGAARQGAHREAAAHYRAAIDHAGRLSPEQHAGLLERYALQAYLAGLLVEGLQARHQAATIREELAQPEQVAENLRWISRLAWWTGHSAQALEAADRAVGVLAAGRPLRQLAMAYSNRAQVHMRAYEHGAAIALGERARALAEQVGDVETAIHATINVQTARLADEAGDAQAALEEAHERAAANGYVDLAVRAKLNLACVTAEELAQYGNAVALIDGALRYAREQNLDGYAQYLIGARANVRMQRCDWAGALADADAALARPGQFAVTAVMPLVARGRIQAACGNPDAISTLDEAARRAGQIGEAQWLAPVAAARSEYFLWNGDADRAADEARQCLELTAPVHQPFQLGVLAYRLWRAGATERPATAVASPFQLMISGSWAEAAAEWAARGATYLRIEAMSAGDPPAAVEALRTLDSLGATRAAGCLRAALRRRGVTGMPRGPRRSTTAQPAGLTVRQVDVLALLADGLSNAEIAGRLTLSRKTVEHHVSALLAKLGVANRVQAAAAYRNHGSAR
ncbi:AAA family ATPase [Amycolatopsis sp. NPDC051716]|uniref:ATP-binding protein n=1 Tax=Amycolatopsis sp. NPDC051716 TaxID=3155804 RepID=UPI00341D6986